MENRFWIGKRVLITGGTSGLGKALAEALVRRRAKVAVVARHRAESAVGHFIKGDVSDKNQMHRIHAEALSVLGGGIDILINNASLLGPTPLRLLMDTECEDFEQVLQTNLIGPFRLSKLALSTMIPNRAGVVVNISSDAAVSAYPRWGAYGVSKAALAHLTKIFQAELEEAGIRFLTVDPGDMDTPMHRAAVPDANFAALSRPEHSAARILEVIDDSSKQLETNGRPDETDDRFSGAGGSHPVRSDR